ncbi:hypothetical protein EOL70_23840 [Leucothrix sargassi]|nr:hypothetical protein EOL70_23840 [Leucothrix sargassi]
MQVDSKIWMTILGFISLSIVISIVTHCWIRYHLKNKAANLPPQSHTTHAHTTSESHRNDHS